MPSARASIGRWKWQVAVQPDLALRGRKIAGDDLDQCRLAGAVVAHQAEHLALLEVDVDALQRLDRAEMLGDVAQLQDRHPCLPDPCPLRIGLARLLGLRKQAPAHRGRRPPAAAGTVAAAGAIGYLAVTNVGVDVDDCIPPACGRVLGARGDPKVREIHPFVLALAFLLTLCSPLDDRSFDRETWLAFHNNSAADNPRGNMARDVQRRLMLGQETREQLLELLGPPDHGQRDDM